MARFPIPCRGCGEPTRDGTHCSECSRQQQRHRIRKHSRKSSARSRGYDEKWRRLSKRAREAQPFCSDCGSREDLQADHSPEAWERYEKGLPLRLADVDVVCGDCNRKRGAARGEAAERRSKATGKPDGPAPHAEAGRP